MKGNCQNHSTRKEESKEGWKEGRKGGRDESRDTIAQFQEGFYGAFEIYFKGNTFWFLYLSTFQCELSTTQSSRN